MTTINTEQKMSGAPRLTGWGTMKGVLRKSLGVEGTKGEAFPGSLGKGKGKSQSQTSQSPPQGLQVGEREQSSLA